MKTAIAIIFAIIVPGGFILLALRFLSKKFAPGRMEAFGRAALAS